MNKEKLLKNKADYILLFFIIGIMLSGFVLSYHYRAIGDVLFALGCGIGIGVSIESAVHAK